MSRSRSSCCDETESPPSRTPAQLVMLRGPRLPLLLRSHLTWSAGEEACSPPHTCSRCPLNLSSVSVISLTSNIYRDALMSEKQTDKACWRCHREGPEKHQASHYSFSPHGRKTQSRRNILATSPLSAMPQNNLSQAFCFLYQTCRELLNIKQCNGEKT